MEELGKRILEGRAFQKKVVGMVLSVLARALKVCRSLDPMVSGEIDREIHRIIDECYAKAKALILENSDVLHKSAQLLLKKEKISPEQLKTKMDENRKLLNHMLPMYSQVARLKIQETDFEKTQKRSIKRYLYQ